MGLADNVVTFSCSEWTRRGLASAAEPKVLGHDIDMAVLIRQKRLATLLSSYRSYRLV